MQAFLTKTILFICFWGLLGWQEANAQAGVGSRGQQGRVNTGRRSLRRGLRNLFHSGRRRIGSRRQQAANSLRRIGRKIRLPKGRSSEKKESEIVTLARELKRDVEDPARIVTDPIAKVTKWGAIAGAASGAGLLAVASAGEGMSSTTAAWAAGAPFVSAAVVAVLYAVRDFFNPRVLFPRFDTKNPTEQQAHGYVNAVRNYRKREGRRGRSQLGAIALAAMTLPMIINYYVNGQLLFQPLTLTDYSTTTVGVQNMQLTLGQASIASAFAGGVIGGVGGAFYGTAKAGYYLLKYGGRRAVQGTINGTRLVVGSARRIASRRQKAVKSEDVSP